MEIIAAVLILVGLVVGVGALTVLAMAFFAAEVQGATDWQDDPRTTDTTEG